MLKRAYSCITRNPDNYLATQRHFSTHKMIDVDSSILKALGLSAKETSIKSHGGSGFSQTLKLTANKDGEEKEYFVKIGGKDSKAMFEGISFTCSISISLSLPANTPISRRTRIPLGNPRHLPHILSRFLCSWAAFLWQRPLLSYRFSPSDIILLLPWAIFREETSSPSPLTRADTKRLRYPAFRVPGRHSVRRYDAG